LSDLEFPAIDLNWTLSNEVTDQFLDLLSSPVQGIGNGSGEATLTAEPINI
jgi:hypothetical protein